MRSETLATPSGIEPRVVVALLVLAACLVTPALAQDSQEFDLGSSKGEKLVQKVDPEQKDKQSAELEAQRRARSGPSSDPREQKIDQLTQALDADPENGTLHYQLANAYQEAGYLHSALQHFNEAVRLDPQNSRAWNNRGSVLKDLNRQPEAVESFQKALEIDPKDVKARVNLGDEYLLEKRYQEAVDMYREALEIDPQSVNAFYSLAISFAETGMYRDAARAWRRAAELEQAQAGEDSEIAKRALENAKLMEEIVADAEKEIQQRQEVKQQLDSEQGGKTEEIAAPGEKKKKSD